MTSTSMRHKGAHPAAAARDAFIVGSACLLLAALADVIFVGVGLSAIESLRTFALWLLIGAPLLLGLAVGAAVLAWLGAHTSSAVPLVAVYVWGVLQALVLWALATATIGLSWAVCVSALGGLVALSRTRLPSPSHTAGIALAFLCLGTLSYLAPSLRAQMPALALWLLGAAVCMATLLLTLRWSARARLPMQVASVIVLVFAWSGLREAGPSVHAYAAAGVPSQAVAPSSPALPPSHDDPTGSDVQEPDDTQPPLAEQPNNGAASPNVVLIVLDTLRADHATAYGSRQSLTPELDAFAERATVYEQCFTTAPWTVPSHASLFTGLYPATHGTSCEHHRYLDDRFTTLAEAFKAKGYETAALVSNVYLEESNLLQGFDHNELLSAPYDRLTLRRVAQVLGFPARYADHGADRAVERVDAFLESRDGRRPLFLFINLLEPHWRHLPPLAERLAFTPHDMGPLEVTHLALDYFAPIAMAAGQPSVATTRALASVYAASVRYQDRRLGQILRTLDSALPVADTLVMVTNDHGENLGEAGRFGHIYAVNDYLVRALLMVRYPRLFAPGHVPGLCSQVDVVPTLSDVVGGLPLEPATDARTLVPARFRPRTNVVLMGDPYLGHFERMEHASGFERDVARWNRRLRAIRTERYKYVTAIEGGAGALYDLANDPDEASDISATSPALANELALRLRARLAAIPVYDDTAARARPTAQPTGPDAAERLRALGYAQ